MGTLKLLKSIEIMTVFLVKIKVAEALVVGSKFVIIIMMSLAASCIKPENLELKIAVPHKFESKIFDPSKVINTQDANIVRSLYSNLLEYDSSGRLVLGLADSYKVTENSIIFSLGKRGIFSNGQAISGYDVEATIIRIILLKQSTHSDLSSLLCDDVEKNGNQFRCQGVVATSNSVKFVLKDNMKVDSFIKALTSHDLRIIPKGSLDENFSIIKTELTSGLYSLHSVDLNLNMAKIIINKHHYRYNANLASTILYKYIENLKEFDALESGDIDLIPTFYPTSYRIFQEKKNDYSTYETAAIKLYFIAFTEKAFIDLSESERIKFGNQVKDLSLKSFPSYRLYKKTDYFFPDISEAYLKDENVTWSYVDISPSSKKFVFRTDKEAIDLYGNNINQYKNIEIQKNDKPYKMLLPNEIPHAYYESMDTAFYDTDSVMIYALKIDLFNFGKKLNEDYIKRLSGSSEAERLELVKDIHRKVLKEGRVIPIVHAPYFAIANKKWKIEFSKYYAGSPVWGITYQGH